MEATLPKVGPLRDRRFLWGVRLAIGFGILFLLVRRADPWVVLTALFLVGPVDIVKAVVMFIAASLLLGGSLLMMLLLPMNPYLVARLLQAHLAGVLLSDLTPARAGYFFTPWVMARLAGIPKESGFAALAGMQAVSFITKACLAIAAMLLLGYKVHVRLHEFGSTLYMLTGTIIAAGIGIAFAILVWTPLVERALHLLRRLATRAGGRRLLGLVSDFAEKFRACGRVGFVRVSLAGLLAAASTLLAGLALYFVAPPTGLRDLSPLDVVMVSLAVGPIVYVPIAPAGLGIVEAAYVFVLSAMGQSASSALTFALAGRVLFTGTDIIGLPWLLKAMRVQSHAGSDEGRATNNTENEAS